MIIIKAKYLVPNPETCIENGAVAVKGSKIFRIGAFEEIERLEGIEKSIHLGNAVILPGLINTHTHLDLTHLHDRIKPTQNFTHWVFQLVGARIRWKDEDYLSSIKTGIQLCIESGTTTVADISHTGHSFSALKNSPLRKVVYREVIGLNPDHAMDILNKTQSELSGVSEDALLKTGLSPHAPYSTSKELYQATARHSSKTGMPLCTHIAETNDEIEFLTKGTGNFPVLLQKLRALADGWRAPGLTSIHYLDKMGFLNTAPLLIHCNYVTDEEISIIRSHNSNVAFCPRSHNFFGHTHHPVQKLLDAGVTVGLGTDSLASNDTLSILDEMKFLFHHYSLSPKTILSLATINGAKAVGLDSITGQIKEGFEADLCGARLPDNGNENIYNRLFAIESKNIFTMVAGMTCYHAFPHP
jgi:cytosine/adenosine deaminase-related metal-dependent hydrolase